MGAPRFGKAPHLVPWLSDGDDLAADLAVHVPVGVNVDVGLTGLHIRNLSRRQCDGAKKQPCPHTTASFDSGAFPPRLRDARQANALHPRAVSIPCDFRFDFRGSPGSRKLALPQRRSPLPVRATLRIRRPCCSMRRPRRSTFWLAVEDEALHGRAERLDRLLSP